MQGPTGLVHYLRWAATQRRSRVVDLPVKVNWAKDGF